MGASVSLSGEYGEGEEDGIALAGEGAGVDPFDAVPPSSDDAPAAPPARDAGDDAPWKYTYGKQARRVNEREGYGGG